MQPWKEREQGESEMGRPWEERELSESERGSRVRGDDHGRRGVGFQEGVCVGVTNNNI